MDDPTMSHLAAAEYMADNLFTGTIDSESKVGDIRRAFLAGVAWHAARSTSAGEQPVYVAMVEQRYGDYIVDLYRAWATRELALESLRNDPHALMLEEDMVLYECTGEECVQIEWRLPREQGVQVAAEVVEQEA